ncbi:MAG TPA: FAD-linked oxidase C-terminal domain-containing protein, partial [Flavitalea sp.]|nr:FAD-linked oxidase C-terminal domain-containing protein [Flavitalea sp.]
ALKHKPMASELVDRYIMDFTKGHPVYQQNRFFIEGEPEAMLMVEFMADDKTVADVLANAYIGDLKIFGYGYAYPILDKADSVKAWDIRKAGLGLLRNLKSDAQPVNLIEDCAVAPEDLPAYIADVQALLAKHNTRAAYYAHAGAGELHVEPIIDLKKKEGVILFRNILEETAILVRKYNGSLSGEHGDGRLRGEYIASVAGPGLYELFKKVKNIFDPELVFNKGKIVNTPPMDQFLRFHFEPQNNVLKTTYDFSSDGGILKLAEKCSGSGDCRKSHQSAGTMCPSYMVTLQEKDTTRARANILREFLSNVQDPDPMDHDEIKDVMDLCLSCKACKSECPSAVDITKMKAEFLQQYYEKKGFPFRSKLVGNFSRQMKLASSFPKFYNLLFQSVPLRKKLNSLVGFHPDRSIPSLSGTTLQTWFKKRKKSIASKTKKVYFFCDEFTNYYDVEIGKKAICLLEALGYEVMMPVHQESGRTFLSKGMVKKAKEIINRNIESLSAELDENTAITGVEPSAILTLKDEYIDLASAGNKQKAKALANKTFTIEEFIAAEYLKGHILKNQFTLKEKQIVLHGHCYQKALSSQGHSKTMLSLPENYKVEIIPSGCCGMAGSFGYEKEHFEISQRIGELILFPFVRSLSGDTIVAAAGTSCRHQIKDGTNVKALHPVEILWDALLINDNRE